MSPSSDTMGSVAFLALLGSAYAQTIDTTTIGAALGQPATGSTRSGTTVTGSLTLDECTYTGPAVTQNTRCYNGAIPGPTFYLEAGDTFQLTITNLLNAEGHDTSSLHNFYRDFDKTNIHTHGLHISSASPGDDIFTEVATQTSYTYTYTIPADHMGGTFWCKCRGSRTRPSRATRTQTVGGEAHPEARARGCSSGVRS